MLAKSTMKIISHISPSRKETIYEKETIIINLKWAKHRSANFTPGRKINKMWIWIDKKVLLKYFWVNSRKWILVSPLQQSFLGLEDYEGLFKDENNIHNSIQYLR